MKEYIVMAKNYANSSENTIAFQGMQGANSDMACRQFYPYMETLSCPSFEDVFNAVSSGKAALGLVPIENSQAGRVAEIHNLLPNTSLHIVSEHLHPVEHHLLAVKGATLETLKTAYSHPQALMQCREHLNELGLERISVSNTAIAAAEVSKWNDPSKAAIASKLAAELYGLEVVKEHIEDSANNTTLFVAISKEPADPSPDEAHILTTVLFTSRNIPAALYKALGGLATNGVNIIKLESYIDLADGQTAQFFVTFEGHPANRSVQLALEELGFFCKKVDVLGVYPADVRRFR